MHRVSCLQLYPLGTGPYGQVSHSSPVGEGRSIGGGGAGSGSLLPFWPASQPNAVLAKLNIAAIQSPGGAISTPAVLAAMMINPMAINASTVMLHTAIPA